MFENYVGPKNPFLRFDLRSWSARAARCKQDDKVRPPNAMAHRRSAELDRRASSTSHLHWTKPKHSRTTSIELLVTKERPRSKNASCRSRTMWWAGKRLPNIAMSGSWMKFQAIRCHSRRRVALIAAIHLRTDKSSGALRTQQRPARDVRSTPESGHVRCN